MAAEIPFAEQRAAPDRSDRRLDSRWPRLFRVEGSTLSLSLPLSLARARALSLSLSLARSLSLSRSLTRSLSLARSLSRSRSLALVGTPAAGGAGGTPGRKSEQIG